MSAPVGNEFWKLVKYPGRKPSYATPQELFQECIEYFQWADKSPAHDKPRAWTLHGLCLYLGITRETWNQYKNKEEFSDVKATIDDAIYDQKFTGAAVNVFNHNIIARDLGLTDKQHLDIKDISTRSREELLAQLDSLEQRSTIDDKGNVKALPEIPTSQTEDIS